MIKVWSKWSHARATHGTEVSLVPLLTEKNSSHRQWIYSYFNDGQNLRDECWLLEIAGRGKPERFSIVETLATSKKIQTGHGGGSLGPTNGVVRWCFRLSLHVFPTIGWGDESIHGSQVFTFDRGGEANTKGSDFVSGFSQFCRVIET